MYNRIFNLLLETDVNDPSARKCKLCGSVAKRVAKGAKRGTRRYQCSSGTRCKFSWNERDRDYVKDIKTIFPQSQSNKDNK